MFFFFFFVKMSDWSRLSKNKCVSVLVFLSLCFYFRTHQVMVFLCSIHRIEKKITKKIVLSLHSLELNDGVRKNYLIIRAFYFLFWRYLWIRNTNPYVCPIRNQPHALNPRSKSFTRAPYMWWWCGNSTRKRKDVGEKKLSFLVCPEFS